MMSHSQQEEQLIQKICNLYEQISTLESLKPSENVDDLFTQLVHTCIQPSEIDISKLPTKIQEIRSNLIKLCSKAESLLEIHFSTILASFSNPLDNLNIFPYYSNYLQLSNLEYTTLIQNYPNLVPNKIAFVGSGPLPLSSIVLALNHFPNTIFHNFDIDPLANSNGFSLISSHPDLSKRMMFHTSDVMEIRQELKEFDVVFLAALVGMKKEEKIKIIDHLAKYMAPNAILLVRSAHGARAFLYPVVDCCDLDGFQVLSVVHPTDEVINSVVVAQKLDDHDHISHNHKIMPPLLDHPNNLILPCKCCSEIEAFMNPLNRGNMVEELAMEEKRS